MITTFVKNKENNTLIGADNLDEIEKSLSTIRDYQLMQYNNAINSSNYEQEETTRRMMIMQHPHNHHEEQEMQELQEEAFHVETYDYVEDEHTEAEEEESEEDTDEDEDEDEELERRELLASLLLESEENKIAAAAEHFAGNINEEGAQRRNGQGRALRRMSSTLQTLQTVKRKLSDASSLDISKHSDILYDTGSIHMSFVVAIAPSPGDTPTWKQSIKRWLLALTSLTIVVTQLVMAFWVTFESSHPQCSTHSDCRTGEFCNESQNFKGDFLTPRCEDCTDV